MIKKLREKENGVGQHIYGKMIALTSNQVRTKQNKKMSSSVKLIDLFTFVGLLETLF